MANIDTFIKKINNDFDRNVARITEKFKKKGITLQKPKEGEKSEQSPDEYVLIGLLQAEKVWKHVQTKIAANYDAYTKMQDNEKIDIICKSYKEFYEEFPIVSRYMACMGQYKMAAFEKMLNKLKFSDFNSGKGSNEDIWIQRQADYIRYLWEECQTKRFQKKDSDAIWNKAYTALSKEFKDFKNLHKETEKKVKEDDIKFRAQLLKEVTERLSKGVQSCDEKKTAIVIETLRNRLFHQRFKAVIKQIEEEVTKINAVTSGKGKNAEAQEEHEQELKLYEAQKNGVRVPM